LSDSDVIDDAPAEGGESADTAAAVLEFLVKSLVDNPDEVRVESDDSGRRLTLNVYVADGDMGRVIGKRGRVAHSIRTVTRAAAVRDDVQIDIEFVD
jgi:predicted RNA-binding protein YlqC (UPF0109 family)